LQKPCNAGRGEWVYMECWWNDTDRGTCSVYGVLVEWHWQGEPAVYMECWWNDTDRENLQCIWSVGGMTLTGRTCSVYGVLVEWHWRGEPEVRAEKRVPPSLLSAQMLHGLACDRTRLLAQETGNRLPEPWRGRPHNYEITLTWWLYAFIQHYSDRARGQYLPVVCPPMQKIPPSLWSSPSSVFKQASKT
jgi:hypothetical protein